MAEGGLSGKDGWYHTVIQGNYWKSKPGTSLVLAENPPPAPAFDLETYNYEQAEKDWNDPAAIPADPLDVLQGCYASMYAGREYLPNDSTIRKLHLSAAQTPDGFKFCPVKSSDYRSAGITIDWDKFDKTYIIVPTQEKVSASFRGYPVAKNTGGVLEERFYTGNGYALKKKGNIFLYSSFYAGYPTHYAVFFKKVSVRSLAEVPSDGWYSVGGGGFETSERRIETTPIPGPPVAAHIHGG